MRLGRVAAALALVMGLVGALVAPPLGVEPGATARAAATDLTLVTNATYAVQPAKARIHVTVAITATNHVAETRTTRYYFDHAFLAVQAGAVALGISGPKGAHVGIARKTADSTLLRIDFGARLYSGASQAFTLVFDLAGSDTAAGRLIRVGASLVTFPVWAFASTGATGSRVTVQFPAGYEVTVESGAFDSTGTGADGGTVLATAPIAAPLSFFAYVSGQQPATYVDTPLSVPAAGGTIALTMRAWKDDPAWATRVGGLLSRALPVLRGEIGLPWPNADAVVIQEAVSRDAGGYAGLYDPAAGRIEVAYWAGQPVIVHEAAHGWFNGSLLADRWANEGFASLYAGRTLAALKIKAAALTVTDALRASAFPLNSWAAVGATDPAAESYGFAASATLAAAIAQRAGDDALGRVWADASSHLGAYPPPVTSTGSGAGPAETVDGPPDWRGLLDVLETETGKDFTDLWRTWVVRPDEAALLDARSAARTAYTRTLAVANGWVLPRSIRDALRAWRFDTATSLMADARTVLAQRVTLEQQASRAGVTLPTTMRALFEAGSFTQAAAEADAEGNAVAAVAEAQGARVADDDLLSRIGMLGEQPETDLAAARSAFAQDHLDQAMTSADDAYRAWSGAWQEGRRRALLAIAVLATVVVLGSAIGARARRARQASRLAAS